MTANTQNALRLSAVNRAARAAGLSQGQPLADARALVPDLVCADADPIGDARALARLARWCGRWSPFPAPARGRSGADGVFLDVTGVAHLFGDEAGLSRDVQTRLASLGYTACVAIADAPGAAWALARFDPRAAIQTLIAEPGAGIERLAHLPVAALRIDPAVETGLRAVGLKRIGDLLRQSRASIARRFGPALLARLDEAGARAPEPIAPLTAPGVREARRTFAEPILTLDQIEAAACELARRLADALDRQARLFRRGVLRLYRVDGGMAEVSLTAATATSDPMRLIRLIRRRLEAAAERLDPGFGIDVIALVAVVLERPAPRLQSLDPADAAQANAEAALSDLAERLAAAHGADALIRLAPVESRLPERAQTRAAQAQRFTPDTRRPPFLFTTPEPVDALAEAPDGAPLRFRWRRVSHRVAKAEGPERIAAEWWRADGPTRDYYRVETAEGRRFWLYRQGLLGLETGEARWFVHGSFP